MSRRGNALGRGARRTMTRHKIEHPPAAPCALSRWIIRQTDKFCVWDTETTGLDDDARIVHIAAVDWTGTKLFETLINPQMPIPPDATAVHGITGTMVQHAPTFAEVYDIIRMGLHNRRWVIYNAGFDVPRLNYECNRNYLPAIAPATTAYNDNRYGMFAVRERREIYCAMEMFAEFYGAWNDYFESYTWQKLATAAGYFGIQHNDSHRAYADSQTTLQVLRHLALNEDR